MSARANRRRRCTPPRRCTETVVTTRRGHRRPRSSSAAPRTGTPVVAFHGFAGPLGGEAACSSALADAGFRVHAPVWPGYSDTDGEGAIDDMLDFTLHGADVVEALELDCPGRRT